MNVKNRRKLSVVLTACLLTGAIIINLLLGVSPVQAASSAIFDVAAAGSNVDTISPGAISGTIISSLTRGPGLTHESFFDNYPGSFHGSKDWATSATRDAGDYMQFTVTPVVGAEVTYTSLSYSLLLQDALNPIYRGPRKWELHYSTDGFVSVDNLLATHDVTAAYTGSAQLKQLPFTDDLSAIGTQTVPVTFRWYGYDTTGSTEGSFAGVSNSANGPTWGDFSWSGTGGNIILDVTVSDVPTTTTLTSSTNPSIHGQSVTFTATVAPAPDGGTVTFKDGGTDISGCVGQGLTAGQATCTISTLALGSHSITAFYSGHAVFLASDNTASPLTQQVNCPNAITVTNINDSGAGSLRQAIADVCAGGTITFNSDMTIPLASQLTIAKNLTIDGTGHAVTLDGNHATRVLNLSGGTLTLNKLTIANGYSSSNGGGAYVGGGTLTVTNSTFSDNSANWPGGGGIELWGGTANIINSTFTGNSAVNGGYGGGIDTFVYTTLNVTNSTFYNNSASSAGGALSVSGTANIINSTIAGNSSNWVGGGGGINNEGSTTLTIKNSIIANNPTGNNCWSHYGASYPFYGSDNLADDATCGAGFTNSSSILLGVLGDYGGSTQTFPLLPGSSAIDTTSTNCPMTDQRDITRSSPTCDIGAFESRGFTLTKSGGDGQSAAINTDFATALQVTVTSDYSEPVTGGQITFTPQGTTANAVITGSPATIAGGAASANAKANDTAGSYTVNAGANGVSANAQFALTNTSSLPTVTTQAVSSITAISATGNGNITATGGVDATSRGILFWTYSNTDKIIGDPGVTTISQSGSFGAGAFTSSLTSLSINAHYNARAYATNSAGTGYGARVSFWTLANVPSAPTVNRGTGTTLDVTVNVNSNPAYTEFCIHETSTGKYIQADGTLGASCVWRTAATWGTQNVSGLTGGNTYTFEVKARNGGSTETAYGATASGTPMTVTTTTVTSSLNPSVFGQSVTFTATVSPTPDGGTVAFKDNGTVITGCDAKSLSGGQATCATSALAVGSHIITAEYNGTTNYAASSGTLSPDELVNQASTTTGVTSSTNPSAFGLSVIFTATVSPTPDGGTVAFKDNGTVITGCGAKSLTSGQATCTTSALAVGSHVITAEYSGTTDYAASSGSLSPDELVNQASTTTGVTSSTNPSAFGLSVTFTATVSPTPDGGTVAFKDNGTVITGCDAKSLTSGQATCATSALAVGSHIITAEYNGTTNYAASSDTLSPDELVNQASTTTGVTSSTNPSTFGLSVTFTATISPTPDGGTVAFKDNATVITGCDAKSLSGGQATCATTALAVGSHVITAEYSGTTNYTASSGSLSPDELVNQASTTTGVTSSTNPSAFGLSVTFTATVTPTPDGGTVAFKDNGTAITGCDAESLTSGQATCATSALAAGSHVITAEYGGATNYAASNGTLSPDQQVNQAGPVLTWSDPADIVYGTALGATQLNATADVPGTFAYTPDTGTVLNVGTHTLHVDFTPTDTANYANASKDVSIDVTQAAPVITWADPADIVYGTTLGAAQLNATADVPGTFAYTPDTGTVLSVGAHTLHVDFTPTDTANYANASKDVSIDVTQAAPVITWADPADIVYGTALSGTQLNATADVTGSFIYIPAADTILAVGTHTLHVDFTPTDTANYTNASKEVSIEVLDVTAPTVLSVTRVDPSPTDLFSVNFTVTFSEPVSGVDVTEPDFDDFSLDIFGLTDPVITAVTAVSDTEYTVTVDTGSGNGTLRLDVLDAGAIVDASNNPLAAGFTSGEVYQVLKSAIFADVPNEYWANDFIERLYLSRITGGCGVTPLVYCPDQGVTRAQLAVFLLRSKYGAPYLPPEVDTETGFADVATDYWAAAWIKQLAAEEITAGCGGGNYCPEQVVTRAEMAVLLLRAKYGKDYIPPAAEGLFDDVPAEHWAAAWIEQLVAEGITGGCGNNNYCPNGPVTRAQIAVFLVTAFDLP